MKVSKHLVVAGAALLILGLAVWGLDVEVRVRTAGAASGGPSEWSRT